MCIKWLEDSGGPHRSARLRITIAIPDGRLIECYMGPEHRAASPADAGRPDNQDRGHAGTGGGDGPDLAGHYELYLRRVHPDLNDDDIHVLVREAMNTEPLRRCLATNEKYWDDIRRQRPDWALGPWWEDW